MEKNAMRAGSNFDADCRVEREGAIREVSTPHGIVAAGSLIPSPRNGFMIVFGVKVFNICA